MSSDQFYYIQIQRAAELLSIVGTSRQAADREIDAYFRKHRNMGKRDRGFVAEAVYACLRQRRYFEAALADVNPDPALHALYLIGVYLLIEKGFSGRALVAAGFDAHAVPTLVQQIRSLDVGSLPIAVRLSLPDWLAERLIAQYGEEETLTLAAALNKPATLDLRVNTLKANREQLAQVLGEQGFEVQLTRYSPVGLRRQERAALFQTEAFRNGLFEVQDEGSQLIAYLVEAQPRELVIDFCAGGGGKALHIGMLMHNTGSLYACDVHEKRLQQLRPRMIRAGLDNIRMLPIENEQDAALARMRGKADRVLVDAPCSGTGTLRRNPDIKWRDIDLVELASLQLRILTSAAKLVKLGGRLVYVTCSLLQEENEQIVTKFLQDAADFQRLSAAEILARQGITIDDAVTEEGAMRLYPHKHGTDGFYAAVLERVR